MPLRLVPLCPTLPYSMPCRVTPFCLAMRFTCLPLPLLTLLSPSEVSSSSPALVMGFFFLLLRDKGNMTREEEAKIQA
ncbi:hypothetical protein GUJ93_ZPchr0004g39242, partial [Zizania palustris]